MSLRIRVTAGVGGLKWLIVGLLVGAAVTVPVWTYATGGVPQTFAAGEVVSASEMNANFADLSTRINNIPVDKATYRWNVFHTYTPSDSWFAFNNPALFGGGPPEGWTQGTGSGSAAGISPGKDVQRALFNRKGYAKKNALVYANTWLHDNFFDGEVVAALFRVRNTTGGALSWSAQFYYTGYNGFFFLELSSTVALNGVEVFESEASGNTTLNLSIPANRTSTVIFVSASSTPNGTRSTLLAFYNNSLDLPAGLEFVDDLDTATGGYEQ